MNNLRVKDLMNEVINSFLSQPNSSLTQLKTQETINLLKELDFGVYLQDMVIFALQVGKFNLSDENQSLLEDLNIMLKGYIESTDIINRNIQEVKDEFVDQNLANAVAPLNEMETVVHKSGNIIHFYEKKYIDATGRKFVRFEFPMYNENQSVLQVDLHDRFYKNTLK